MSTHPKLYNTEAVVLKHTPFGEADYVVTLYTPDAGKLRAVVRGARKVKSRMGGHLEPLMHSSMLLARGKNLDTVNQAESREGFRAVREDLHRLSQALYMAELVDSITPDGQPNYPIFRLLLDSLRSLVEGAPVALLPFFQLQLLEHSGFRPELYRCVECDTTLEPSRHRFAPSQGGTLCETCRPERSTVLPLSLSCLKVLRFLQKGESEAVARLSLDSGILSELERLLGGLYAHVLDRDVRSARFLRLVAQSGAEGGEGLAEVGDARE